MSNPNFHKSACITALLFCAFVLHTDAARAETMSPGSSANIQIAKQHINAVNQWLNSAWTDDDKPYAAARARIDRSIASGYDPLVIMSKCDSGIFSKQINPINLFCYTYSAYKFANKYSSSSNEKVRVALNNIYLILAKQNIHLPNTYNYSRLAFLATASCFPAPNLVNIGKRLYTCNPNDDEVKFYYIQVLNFNDSTDQRILAQKYANEYARKHPDTLRTISLLAIVAYRSAYLSKNAEEADKAITYYKKASALYLNDAAMAQWSAENINGIEVLKKQWQAQR